MRLFGPFRSAALQFYLVLVGRLGRCAEEMRSIGVEGKVRCRRVMLMDGRWKIGKGSARCWNLTPCRELPVSFRNVPG